MKLSTRARYGTKALLGIVLHWDEEPVLLKDIKQRQQIPLRYLERLIRPPVQVEITKTTRGTRGEVSLINPSNDGMLSEIIQLPEGSSAPVDCVDSPEVWPRSDRCVTHDIWDEVKEAISKALGSATSQELAEHPREKVWQRRLKK